MKGLEKVIRCFALLAVLCVSGMQIGCAGEEADEPAAPPPTTPEAPATPPGEAGSEG